MLICEIAYLFQQDAMVFRGVGWVGFGRKNVLQRFQMRHQSQTLNADVKGETITGMTCVKKIMNINFKDNYSGQPT